LPWRNLAMILRDLSKWRSWLGLYAKALTGTISKP